MNERVRFVQEHDLHSVLNLYKHLQPYDPELNVDQRLTDLWSDILQDPNMLIIVCEKDGQLISTCVVAIIKNLTRGARPYAVIENVVTHEEYRHQGYGRRVLLRALDVAQERDCYKVMLMTSRSSEETLQFYERTGFERGKKIGFVKYF
ncbi:GNAT family N-acetyltransferase [Paenibacillus sp. 1001270B_150601_E10]|uniref:GNAT family N-acetyltransferase n=1 Tax=Paenibacillus sp. 1001270B_150601_E10 TaxID=2787079 RepID=UPI00189DCBE8|nr:GNAT family N-acetyltransferase [Paenibacillus sp. 1001270B_150601_E10]